MNELKNIIGILPARMASSRFPGKPMALIHGIPMIGHCYFRSKMCAFLKEVYVATCDNEISDYVRSIGGKAIMTSDTHTRASDRTAEALLKIEEMTGKSIDIVVMIQGDEPMLTPGMIASAVEPLINDPKIMVTNLMAPVKNIDELMDPNEVKVVVDKDDFALYFSREPIPSEKKVDKSQMEHFRFNLNKQVCIIPFQRDFLITFNNLQQTPLEMIESVDMLRVIEHGFRLKMIKTYQETYSVDTEKDRKKVERLMIVDELLKHYSV